jgi:hypothetical protein
MPNSPGSGLPNPQSYDTSDFMVVVDRVTGLMWARGYNPSFYSFANANAFCDSVSYDGYTDWRTPSAIEMETLFAPPAHDPALDATVFPYWMPTGGYWTSTPMAESTSGAWFADLGYGETKTQQIDIEFQVVCLRGGPSGPVQPYVVRDGTVYDPQTRLIWQQASSPTTLDAQSASQYCADLVLAGQSDWRLPSVGELHSLVDYGKYQSPQIDTTAFPDTPVEKFWTLSPPWAGQGSWAVDFSNTIQRTQVYSATALLYARCVRSNP